VRRYIDDVRRGRGQSGKQYSARYICSLVADFHRRGPSGSAARSPAAVRGRVWGGSVTRGAAVAFGCRFQRVLEAHMLATLCSQGLLLRRRRTLLYGGVAMNPRSHLRLVYEANPLAFLAEQARPSHPGTTPP